MKFRVDKGTQTFEKLSIVREQLDAIDNQCKAIAEEVGAGSWARSTAYLAGSIVGFKFEECPTGYYRPFKQHPNLFYPKKNVKANRPILEAIGNVPTLDWKILNDAIGFTPQAVGRSWYGNIGVRWRDEYFLLDIQEEADYTPMPDMVEITVSEYKRLSEAEPVSA